MNNGNQLKDTNGLYEVSNTGLVKSLPRVKINNRGKQITKVKKLKDILNMENYLENECYCPR